MNTKDLLYAVMCLTFIIMIGGGTYEHVALVPHWSAAPPASLGMFQGKYPLNAAPFWMSIHPINLLLMIAALIAFWKTARRKHIGIVMGAYLAIIAVTAVYFVPELMSITGTAFSETPDPALTERAQRWEMLSLVRLVILLCLATYLVLGLTKQRLERLN